MISSLYAAFQLSWRPEKCLDTEKVVLRLDIYFRIISFSVFIAFIMHTCGNAQTVYLPLEPRTQTDTQTQVHVLKCCSKQRRINASGKQDTMNIPEAPAINVHTNTYTPTHKQTHTATKCDYPINADIRRRCCQCKAQLLTL